MDKRVYWLWLVMVFGPANNRLWTVGSNYDKIEEYVYALQSNMISDLTDREIESILKIKIKDAESVFNECQNKNIDIYCYESEGYPDRLRLIANPPAVLFCRGNLDFLNKDITIAVVGTRNPSEYSVDVAHWVCKELSQKKYHIISGLATGIDQISNVCALEMGVATCGVSGRGIDVDYPVGSDQLKNRIANNGAVISETCSMLNFPHLSFSKRNRIIIGLSDSVVFIECSATSKGLDNVDHAISQGKQVFVVPPRDVLDKRYFGQRDLIRRGCKVFFSCEDFTYYISNTRIEDVCFESFYDNYNEVEDSSIFSTEEKIVRKPRKKATITQNKNNNKDEIAIKKNKIDYSKLNQLQSDICRLIEIKPMLADNISTNLNRSIMDILTELTILEIKGIIKALPGKMFTIMYND